MIADNIVHFARVLRDAGMAIGPDRVLAALSAVEVVGLDRREDVHAACPDVVETIKWSRPHFTLDDKLLCGMSAFKAHCSFGFWQREGAESGDAGAMGDFGRIASIVSVGSSPRCERVKSLPRPSCASRAAPSSQRRCHTAWSTS